MSAAANGNRTSSISPRKVTLLERYLRVFPRPATSSRICWSRNFSIAATAKRSPFRSQPEPRNSTAISSTPIRNCARAVARLRGAGPKSETRTPLLGGQKRGCVTGCRQRTGNASQIFFGSAAGRKTAPDESNVQFLGSLYLHAVSTIVLPMSGETLNPTAPPRIAARSPCLPKNLLYSISARIGGWGLDPDAFETLRASYRGGFLGKAIAYDNRQNEIPASKIRSLRWHPVRLLSSLDRPHYYGAKKKYLDWIASRQLGTGQYDLLHSWSGDCLESLRVAQGKGIPSILEIPTWHRDFAERVAPRAEPRRSGERTPIGRWKNELILRSERSIEEYDLATLLLVLSERAAETFRESGMAKEKLFYLPRGVDVQRFKPGARPPIFRAVFSGALIERKGIHHLLEAWHRLNLKDAKL